MKKQITSLAVAVILMVLSGTVQGDVALSFTGGSPLQHNSQLTLGWSFVLFAPISVSALGYYDNFDSGTGPPGDGLLVAHPVVIWAADGTPLLSGTVPAGSAGSLLDGFRYVAVSPTILPPGNYTIGASSSSSAEFVKENASSVTTPPEIAFGGRRTGQSVGGQPGFPGFGVNQADRAWFGPNFQFAVVPEPSSAVLLLLGGGLSLAVRLRSSRANLHKR